MNLQGVEPQPVVKYDSSNYERVKSKDDVHMRN